MSSLLPAMLLALFFSAFAVEMLRRKAPVFGLLDHPGGRKAHENATPVVGGLAVASALLLTWAVVPAHSPLVSCQVGFALLVVLGAVDDRMHLRAGSKFLFQAFVAGAVLVASGVSLQSLGEVVPGWALLLGWFAVPFSVFAAASVMNAFNMSDGVDGLAGSLALVALVSLSLIAVLSGNAVYAADIIIVAAAVVGFLLFNFRLPGGRPARVFMGDAGSLGLGFLIAFFALQLASSEQAAVPPAVLIWICAVPLFDGLSVILSRLVRRAGASLPGRDHLHHLLLRLGASPAQVAIFEAGAGFVLAILAIGSWQLQTPEWALVVAFATGFAAFHFVVTKLWAGLHQTAASIVDPPEYEVNHGVEHQRS
jgi:UDP-GlcNAc:undecaprenyl-phosphate GlcNAc-1-phosphate transferase